MNARVAGRGFSFEEAGSSSDSDEDSRRRRLEAEGAANPSGSSLGHVVHGVHVNGMGQAATGGRTEFAFHRQLQAHYGQTTHIRKRLFVYFSILDVYQYFFLMPQICFMDVGLESTSNCFEVCTYFAWRRNSR